MNGNTPAPDGKGSARRRLLRGSFAAPVVLTLYSGGALAVASNRRCVKNDSLAKQSPLASGSADTWLRVQLWTLADSMNPALIDSSWIFGANLDALMVGRPTDTTNQYLTGNQYECFTVETGSTFSVGDKFPVPAKQGYVLRQNGSYVAVRVDIEGNIVGIVKTASASDPGAVHRSCWTSFKA